jgi:3-oxochol-4-en-24-oyl-CoA dehydrogenase
VKVRPINTITGDEEFSEVFLDDVVVPGENLVGKLNDGWRILRAGRRDRSYRSQPSG